MDARDDLYVFAPDLSTAATVLEPPLFVTREVEVRVRQEDIVVDAWLLT